MGDNNIEAVSLLTQADAQIFKLCFWVGTEERRSVRLWRILAQLVSAFFFFQQSTFHTRYKALQANSSISNSRNTLNKTMGCKRKRNAGLGIRKKKRGKGTPAKPHAGGWLLSSDVCCVLTSWRVDECFFFCPHGD